MRILLSLGLLFLLLSSAVVFAYYFRRRLMAVFGITPPGDRQKRDQDLEDDRVGGRSGPMATELGSKGNHPVSEMVYPKGGGQRPSRALSEATSSGSMPSTGSKKISEASSNKPMIVIADDGGNRGASIPYDALAQATGQWAESRRIGSGGAAIVYRAELPRYGSVAVKRFHVKDGSSREWTRELEALCQCRHPHILEIIGHADEGPENLIVMPLMEGGTLCEAMHKLTWSTRVANMGQVVRALSFLHGKGILHRDVKSSNILLDGSLRYSRLADFGLAKDQVARAGKTCHGTTGIVQGSPGYMAPELMMRPANEKTDAFATGVVFLEILTGLPAWDIDEDGAILTDRAVSNGKIVDGMLDPAGQWPQEEVADCSKHAIALTVFDPAQRTTLAAMEQDSTYKEHLERARAIDQQRYGGPCKPGTVDS